jgi:hypothetical protein
MRVTSEILKGCELWCVTLRDERMLTMFDNTVLSIIYRPNGPFVARAWERLRNEKLHGVTSDCKYLSGKTQEGEVGGACGTDWEKRNA